MKHAKWRIGGFLTAASAVLLLSGCLSVGTDPVPMVVQGKGQPQSDGYLSIVVAPGQTGSCQSTPCTVYYRTPDLGKPVEVVVNNFIVGTFPPGKTVRLGDFNDTSNIISVKGSGTPDAYVNLPGSQI